MMVVSPLSEHDSPQKRLTGDMKNKPSQQSPERRHTPPSNVVHPATTGSDADIPMASSPTSLFPSTVDSNSGGHTLKHIPKERPQPEVNAEQLPTSSEKKVPLSFPHKSTNGINTTEDVLTTDSSDVAQSVASSQDSSKGSRGPPMRSQTAPTTPTSPRRRPNSFTALPDQQDQHRPGKHKKVIIPALTDIEDFETMTRRKKVRRRNTYSVDLTENRREFRLDDEAQKWAEQVKKRRSVNRKREIKEEDMRVVIGTRIGEDHVNYVLMYNMLTGIRVAVSRCTAKPMREVTDVDFKAAHKLAFDISGNELTPSAKYDFKFKDYAPWVFRHLRDIFHIDPADYLISLTSKYILSELGSPGKSGSFFYFSRDYRFIIKTIHHTEHKFMRKILKDYHEHIKHNPNTLLSRFYGLHRVKLPHGRKIHFVIMNNIFPPHRDVHETYDLKGSTFGREFSEDEAKLKPRAVLKDINWLKRERHLELGPEKRRIFIEQLQKDVELLARLNIMDYSLLVGFHDTSRGNKDNIREGILAVFQPDTKKLERVPSGHKRSSKISALRKAVVESDPVKLSPENAHLTIDASAERRYCIFYMDDGGFAATDELNRPTNCIYYLGVIDILTPYNAVKKVEHFWKSLRYEENAISAVKPVRYGKRFLDFITKTIRHNEDLPPLHDNWGKFNSSEKKETTDLA